VPRRLIFIFIALLLSAGAFFLAQQWLRGQAANAPPGQAIASPPPAVRVLVAKTELPVGSILGPDSIRWQVWPGDDAPPDYIVDRRGPAANLAGAMVRVHLLSGEPITPAEVARVGDKSAMSAMLSPGTRAMTINVSPNTGLAGFLSPGDRVDVIVTMSVPNRGGTGNARRVSQTILSNLRVVGTDQSLTDEKKTDAKGATPPKTVSLEVTPKQAEILAVAIDLGVVNLTLHSLASTEPGGGALPVTQTWDTDATHGVYSAPAEAEPAKAAASGGVVLRYERRVQVVRGDQTPEMVGADRLKPIGVAPTGVGP